MDYPIKTLKQTRTILIGFRKQAGLSQADVAALLGVTQQSYAKIEANPTATSVERLFTILRLLGGEIVLTHRTQLHDDSTVIGSFTKPTLSTASEAQPVLENVLAVIDSGTENILSAPVPAKKKKVVKDNHSVPSKISSPSVKKERW